jgi:hypothetical protein
LKKIKVPYSKIPPFLLFVSFLIKINEKEKTIKEKENIPDVKKNVIHYSIVVKCFIKDE